jgi:hypothetical protein
MTFTNTSTVDDYGFAMVVSASTDTPPEAREGDTATYRLAMVPDVGFLAETSMSWTFSGQMEKAVVVGALRELALQLERL